ncbi:hypothetical protein HDU98_012302 [Podochytrium sp. JEL0797]|nr:hypothetical protein HDU98_012302 [Podochytrium sp. JEL0797]
MLGQQKPPQQTRTPPTPLLLRNHVSTVVTNVQMNRAFATGGVAKAFEAAHPKLRVDGVGRVPLPLVPHQAKEVQGATKSFTFALANPTSSWSLEKLALAGLNASGGPANHVTLIVRPTKLVLQSQHSTSEVLAPNPSIPYAPFASLILQLPSDFTGGEIHVARNGKRKKFAFHQRGPFFEASAAPKHVPVMEGSPEPTPIAALEDAELARAMRESIAASPPVHAIAVRDVPLEPEEDQPMNEVVMIDLIDEDEEEDEDNESSSEASYESIHLDYRDDEDAFFYTFIFDGAEVTHAPITSGHKLCIHFDVFQSDNSLPPVSPSNILQSASLLECYVSDWISMHNRNLANVPSKLMITLPEYIYNHLTQLTVDALQDRDRTLFQILQNIKDENGRQKLAVHLVTLTRKTLGWAHFKKTRYDDGYSDDCDSEMDDDDEDEFDEGCLCHDSGICHFCKVANEMEGYERPETLDWLQHIAALENVKIRTFTWNWVSPEGRTAGFSHVSFDFEKELVGIHDSVPSEYALFQGGEPTQRRCVKDCGDYTREVELIDEMSFLVFWPKEMNMRVGGLKMAIDSTMKLLAEDPESATKELQILITYITTSPTSLIPTHIDRTGTVLQNVQNTLHLCTHLHRIDLLLRLLPLYQFSTHDSTEIPFLFWTSLASLSCTRDVFIAHFLPTLKTLAIRDRLVPLLLRAHEKKLPFWSDLVDSLIPREWEQVEAVDLARVYRIAVECNAVGVLKAMEGKGVVFSFAQLNAMFDVVTEVRGVEERGMHVKWIVVSALSKPTLLPGAFLTSIHRLVVEHKWDAEMHVLEAKLATLGPSIALSSIQTLLKDTALMQSIETWKPHVLRLCGSGIRRDLLATQVSPDDLFWFADVFLKVGLTELARVYVRTLLGMPIASKLGESKFDALHGLALEKTWLDELNLVEDKVRKEMDAIGISKRLMVLFKHPMFHTSLQFRVHCERVMDLFVDKDLAGFNASKEHARELAKFYATLLRYAFVESLERVGEKIQGLSISTVSVVVYDALKFLMKLLKLQERTDIDATSKDYSAFQNSIELQSTVHTLTLSLFSKKPDPLHHHDYFTTFPCLEYLLSKTCFLDPTHLPLLQKTFLTTIFDMDAHPPTTSEPGDLLSKVISNIHTHSPTLLHHLHTPPLQHLLRRRISQIDTFLHHTHGLTATSWSQPFANLTLVQIEHKDQITAFLAKPNESETRIRGAQFGSLQSARNYASRVNQFVARKEFGVYMTAEVVSTGGARTAQVVLKKDKRYRDALCARHEGVVGERVGVVRLLREGGVEIS